MYDIISRIVKCRFKKNTLRTSFSVLGPPNSLGLYLTPDTGVGQPSGSLQAKTKGSLVEKLSILSIGEGVVVRLLLNFGLANLRDCLAAKALATGPRSSFLFIN